MKNEIFFMFEKVIEENETTINELLKIDNKHCKIKANKQSLIKVLNSLKSEKIEEQILKRIKFKYNGNPNITLNLIILAILTRTTIILDFNQNMLGINKFLIKTANNILKEINIEELIFEKAEEQIDEVIFIDDINAYNEYLRKGNKKAKFYSYEYIDFYCNSNEFDEITELIHKYAEENLISLETYSELEKTEAVNMIQQGLGRKLVLLTQEEETKKLFRNIKNKKLYINKNPFEQEIEIIKKEIFNK